MVENVFTIPGLGQFGIDAISGRDYPQVQAFILVTALVFVFSNLVVDILYAILDPRISYARKSMRLRRIGRCRSWERRGR